MYSMHKEPFFESGLKVLVPVETRYQKAVDYSSYCPILKSQRYNDDVAWELQEERKKNAV